MTTLDGEQNPFVRYRERLDSYDAVRNGTLSDEQFVDIVAGLDEQVAQTWGRGFQVSPFIDGAELAAASDLDVNLSIKVEAGGVGGSHKSRHLMGVAISNAIAELNGAPVPTSLAIASCGNAALGAAVIARSLDRTLDVFVPTWADEAVVEQLNQFGARINRCERRDGEAGDPCYLRFKEAVHAGADAFSVQGIDTPATFDGARTIGWEIAEQATSSAHGDVTSLYVQVGGGALATAVSRGLPDARLHPVQAEGCAPLRRAWDRMAPDFDLDAARQPDQTFMTPWEDPQSFATGILDDITYDWIPLIERTRATGGHPIVVAEPLTRQAYDLAHAHTDVNVCSTGAAGFAGLLAEPAPPTDHVVVLFTGIDRS